MTNGDAFSAVSSRHFYLTFLIHWKEVEDIFDCTSQCAEKQWCEILIGGLEQYQMEMFSVYIFTIILYDIHKVFQRTSVTRDP